MSEKIRELDNRLAEARSSTSTARARIDSLLDEGSFVEIGAFVKQRFTDFIPSPEGNPSDGVVCGYGRMDERPVYIYSQDKNVLGGSIGEMHARKIESLYDNALKMGCPVIAIIDSKGVRLNENVDALDAYGKIFSSMSKATGVIPQISIILGDCIGGMTFVPALSDFVFMSEKDARFFMSSPNSIPGSESRTTTFDKLGGGKAHSEKSGLVHFCLPDEKATLECVKEFFDYLPSNNMEEPPLFTGNEDIEKWDESLNNMCESSSIDVYSVISSIADSGQFLEVSKDYSKGIVTGFARFDGFSAGIVANNKASSSLFDNQSMMKATAFINFCDSFNIPVISMTDISGFKPSVSEEHNGIIKNAAKLMYAFSSATVPKINIVLGDAIGSSYIIMNSKHIGADIVYAWPSAKISVMDAEAAVNIMLADDIKKANDSLEYRDELIGKYEEMQASPYTAAGRGYIDNIIVPADTRKHVIYALEILSAKRVSNPSKKHSSF